MTQATVGFLDANGHWVPVQDGVSALPTSSGGGGTTVTSVNGETGEVILAASDVGALPTSYAPTWGSVTGKPSTFPPADHTHAAGDTTSGTFSAARIPTLAQSKVTGLQSALDSIPADAADLPATAIAPGTATTVQGILEELAARISALEP